MNTTTSTPAQELERILEEAPGRARKKSTVAKVYTKVSGVLNYHASDLSNPTPIPGIMSGFMYEGEFMIHTFRNSEQVIHIGDADVAHKLPNVEPVLEGDGLVWKDAHTYVKITPETVKSAGWHDLSPMR